MKKETEKQKRNRLKETAVEFNNEIKKALNTALIAAFGFIIALAWRDLINEYLKELTAISPLQGQLYTAIIITFVSVIGIILVTRFIRKPEDVK